MSKVVVILQSNYIPWKGYFDLMNAADEFVLFDEVQYTRRDWRNRNKIIVAGEEKWLTIPLKTKGHYHTPISAMEVSDRHWAERHFSSLCNAYASAAYFADYRDAIQQTYERAARHTRLSEINRLFLDYLATALGITTHLIQSDTIERKATSATGRLVEICRELGADRYLCGPASRHYLDHSEFEGSGVHVIYADYSRYPAYDQHTEKFTHQVSVVDVLMRAGPAARSHVKSQRSLDALSGTSTAE